MVSQKSTIVMGVKTAMTHRRTWHLTLAERYTHSLEPNYMVSFCLPPHRDFLHRPLDWVSHFHCKSTIASQGAYCVLGAVC